MWPVYRKLFAASGDGGAGGTSWELARVPATDLRKVKTTHGKRLAFFPIAGMEHCVPIWGSNEESQNGIALDMMGDAHPITARP
jgi:hypothetical protein